MPFGKGKLRFTHGTADTEMLVDLGGRLNHAVSGAYDGLGRRGDTFAASVCESDLWFDHVVAIKAFSASASAVIVEARSLGCDVTFDVAVEPEDRKGRNILSEMLEKGPHRDRSKRKEAPILALCSQLAAFTKYLQQFPRIGFCISRN